MYGGGFRFSSSAAAGLAYACFAATATAASAALGMGTLHRSSMLAYRAVAASRWPSWNSALATLEPRNTTVACAAPSASSATASAHSYAANACSVRPRATWASPMHAMHAAASAPGPVSVVAPAMS